MNSKRKKLIQLRAELKVYKEIDIKITAVLDAKVVVEDLSEEIYNKVSRLEEELDNLKMDMNLPDAEWDEDEKS